MLDFDASKLLIIGVVALVVIGPKDLPRVLRQVGQMVGKLRRMAGEFQGQFMDAMKEADLQDLRDEVAKLKNTASLDVDFHPVRDATTELNRAMEGIATPVAETGHLGIKDFSYPSSSAPPSNLVAAGIAPTVEESQPEPPSPDTGLPSEQPIALRESEVVLLSEPEAATASPVAVPPVADPVPAMDHAVPRRKVRVPKRRPPGDRMLPPVARSSALWRSRSYLPPRRETPLP